MRKFIALAILTLTLASSARAQWIVYDPTSNIQSILNTAQEIAKFVEMIQNQVQQIEQLTEQVQTLHHYVDLFGDPSKFAPASIAALTADLKQTELGETLGQLQSAADAATAMAYTGAGLFQAVNEQFTTPNGATVQRREQPYPDRRGPTRRRTITSMCRKMPRHGVSRSRTKSPERPMR
jgi:P-type conjugative transfer protein TrbJ